MYETWFINVDGETYGPLSTDAIEVMLKQNRIQFSDFIWKKTFSKWIRVIDVKVFALLLPPYPKAPLPTSEHPLHLLKVPVSSPRNTESLKAELGEKKVSKLRQSPRIIIEGRVVIKGVGSFRILDVSEEGVYVSSMNPIELGTVVHFTLQTESLGEHSGSGNVVRHNADTETPGFAIHFTEIDQLFIIRIQAHILAEQSGPKKKTDSI